MPRPSEALFAALLCSVAVLAVARPPARPPHPGMFRHHPALRKHHPLLVPPLRHTYQEGYFDQTVDHFNLEHGNRTFRQRYLYNTSFWSGPERQGPVFLYTDAEGVGVDNTWDYSGWVLELAERFAALPVFVEHRFFGKSRLFANDSDTVLPLPDHIGLLSEEQVLADLVLLVEHVQLAFNASACPVVAFGGSLAGSLATYLRLKYPFVADIAVASSAPILGYEGLADPYAYYKFVTDKYHETDPNCPRTVQQGFHAYAAATIDDINAAFNPCTPLADEDFWFIYSIAWGFLGWYPSVGYPPSQNLLPYACQRMTSTWGLDIFAQLLQPYHVDQCFNLSDWNTTDISGQYWGYLSCTEIVHPVGTNNVTDMFPPGPWDTAVFTQNCQEDWNVTPRYRWIPQSMGTADLRNVARSSSRIVFTNGGLDAWSTSGVLHNVSDSIHAIFIPEAGHVSDFTTPSDDDTAGMIAARQQIADYIAEWLPQVRLERRRAALVR